MRGQVVGLVFLLLGVASTPVAAADVDLEYRLRAAFLVNFVRFVSWESAQFTSPASAIELCIPEADPVAPALEELVRDKRIDAHPLTVRRLKRGARWDGCHLAYTGAAPSQQSAAVFRALGQRPVLTVHESAEALPGGVIRLFLEDRKLRFEVNTAAVDQGPLKLSSQLMSLAVLVRVEAPQ
ncbi:MAG: YfiR family protein [Pseudomonadota bacterium]